MMRYLASAGPAGLPSAAFTQLLGPLIAFVAIPRIVAGPVVVVAEGLAMLLVRQRNMRIVLAAAMLMDRFPDRDKRGTRLRGDHAAKSPRKLFADKSPDPGVSLFWVLRGLSLMDIAERFFVAAAAASLLLIVATAWLVELS